MAASLSAESSVVVQTLEVTINGVRLNLDTFFSHQNISSVSAQWQLGNSQVLFDRNTHWHRACHES